MTEENTYDDAIQSSSSPHDHVEDLLAHASLEARDPATPAGKSEDGVWNRRADIAGDNAENASPGENSTALSGEARNEDTCQHKKEEPAGDAESGAAGGDGVQKNAAPKPKFASKCQLGYATEQARKLWLVHRGMKDDEVDEEAMSLVASMDPTKPIYYWQLFSVLGKDRIMQLVRTFYENVYEDEEYTKLRKVFQKVPGTTPDESLDHHIRTQSQYWMDAFGGGKKYHGGTNRLELHHRYNAMEVMNTEAATRWTFHMNRAIQSADLTKDPRVKECLCDFLKTHMDKYGEQFKFQTQKLAFGQVREEIVRDKRGGRRRDRESEKEEKEDAAIERKEERKAKGREGGAKKGGGSKGRR